jgi:hypothetical protein
MGQFQQTINFVLCIENRDCDDLEKGKVYQVLSDDNAAKEGKQYDQVDAEVI